MKNIRVFLAEKFPFLEVKFYIYLNRRAFAMTQEMWYWEVTENFWRAVYRLCHGKLISFTSGPRGLGKRVSKTSPSNKMSPEITQINFSYTSALHHENLPIILTPLKPHFYIVKLGFTGVYIIFLISAQNIDCGYSLEPPRQGGSNEYPQSIFLSENFQFFGDEIFYILE